MAKSLLKPVVQAGVVGQERERVVLEAAYGPRAQDMWRWVDEEADEPIGEFVARLARLDSAEREATTATSPKPTRPNC